MRIFYAAYASPNVWTLPESKLWDENLLLPLRDLGHEVIPFDYDLAPHFRNLDESDPRQRRFVQAHRPALVESLLRQIEAEHRRRPIDLFFSYFYSACITPEAVAHIRGMGIATCNFYCNAAHQFDLIRDIAPAYDFCLVTERFRLADYKAIGANPIYCQEAANPNVYHPRDVPRDLGVVFLGQCYGERPAYIARLVRAGVPVRVWGPGWLTPRDPRTASERWLYRLQLLASREGIRTALGKLRRGSRPAGDKAAQGVALPPGVAGPPLSDREMVEMYSRAKITLGFSAVGDALPGTERVLQVRLRDFEAPMSGAFYLVEYMPELEEFFEPGKEIACYRDAGELVALARYYLEHDDERERIRQAGYRRALAEHTWQKRLSTSLAAMGLAGA